MTNNFQSTLVISSNNEALNDKAMGLLEDLNIKETSPDLLEIKGDERSIGINEIRSIKDFVFKKFIDPWYG